MIISGNPSLDFQSIELMQFVQSATSGDQLDVQKNVQNGFHSAVVRGHEVGVIPAPKGGLIVPWTLIQQWAINEDGKTGPQRIQTFTIETTAWREVEAMLCVELLVKDSVSEQIEKSICDAFTAYQYPGGGDIDTYIENSLKALPDVSPYAFGLSFYYRVRLLSDQLIDKTSLQRVQSGLNDRYRLQQISSESILNVLRPNPPHPNTKEEVNSETAVRTVADKNQPGQGCDGLTTDYKEFAKGVFLPESRTVWKWRLVVVGCAKFHIWWPETEFRDRELVASVYWTHPGPLDQYVKKMVEDCARESATASVVALIVFVDLATALSSFKALFWQCLRDKLGQTLSCLDVGLVVNTVSKGDWH
jgi:hypothetical protein